MTLTVVLAGQANFIDQLTANRLVRGRHFIFRVNGMERALWYTGAAINACAGVNVIGRELFNRRAGIDRFHRADIRTAIVAQTQTCNDMGHEKISFDLVYKEVVSRPEKLRSIWMNCFASFCDVCLIR